MAKLVKGSRRHRERLSKVAKRNNRRPNVFPCRCKRCGYSWRAKVAKPKFCSRCKQTIWNVSLREIPARKNRKNHWLPKKRGENGHSLKRGKLVHRVGSRWLTPEQHRQEEKAAKARSRAAKKAARTRRRLVAAKKMARIVIAAQDRKAAQVKAA